MAQVANPFFSLSASGSAGGLTAVENALHRAHVQWAQQEAARRARGLSTSLAQIMRFQRKIAKISSRKTKPKSTSAQSARRTKLKECAAAWRTLDAPTKALWNARRLTVYKPNAYGLAFTVQHGYALFVRQWMHQAIVPPALPRLPA